MINLYLIAHKVRGKPAFDAAQRMRCPICCVKQESFGPITCDECEASDGWWWIIPTSGHRAYPYWQQALIDFPIYNDDLSSNMPEMPANWPDHYAINDRPSDREAMVLRPALSNLLGLKKPPADFKRRV